MHMIVGLGNPGSKYTLTKHNVGFWVIDAIAKEMDVLVEKKQCQALTGTGLWQGKKVLLVKPQTFMNLSGQAVIELLNYYADRIDDLLIIHDDLDLLPGMLRFKQNGSSGGHNGLKSIASHLNSTEFDRLKLGIGKNKGDAAGYVLAPFAAADKVLVDEAVQKAVEATACWLTDGMAVAMNRFNQKKK